MAAGNADHRVEGVRAAGERRVHAFDIVRLRARRQAESLGQFLCDDRLAVAGDDDVDVMRARVEVVEETLGIKRAAGPGDGDNDFQSGKRIMAHYGEVELSGQARFAQPAVRRRNFGSREGILLESTQPFRTIKRVLNGWKRVVLASIKML